MAEVSCYRFLPALFSCMQYSCCSHPDGARRAVDDNEILQKNMGGKNGKSSYYSG